MELPNKLSELLRVAINDVRQAEDNENYVVDMDKWHEPIEEFTRDRRCAVCMGGAVMAFTLNTGYLYKSPVNFNEEIEWKLQAINAMRYGDFFEALSQMHKWEGTALRVKLGVGQVMSEAHKIQLNEIGVFITDMAEANEHSHVPFKSHAPWDDYETAADELETMGL